MDTPSVTTNGFYFGEVEGDEQFHGDNFIQLDSYNLTDETNRSAQTNYLNEFEQIFDMIIPSASINLFENREITGIQDVDDLLSWPTTEFDTLLPIAHNNSVLQKPDENASIFDADNVKSITIEQYLAAGISGDGFDTYETQGCSTFGQQSVTDIAIASNQENEMRFEVDPAPRFRGRTSSDFIPKKAHTRKGEPSKPRSPRYFTDGRTRQYLNLLIPQAYLSSDRHRNCLEICIVTPEINGYTYIHPYFKFQTHPTDPQSPNINPMYISFDNTTELKPFLGELFQQLELKLVVVMLTNNELMQADQPLTIFSTPKNNHNQSSVTHVYNKHDTFKKAYRLHQIRFAVTLWKNEPDEEVFYRHDDKQCISTISTEDKKTRVRTKKSTVN